MRTGKTLFKSRAEQSRAEQSRAEQSRAEQSRAEHGLTAPFLRLARRLKLHITFEMDDRRILMGLVYPVRFGGFCALTMRSAKDKMEAGRRELAHGRTDYRLDADAANAASLSERSSRDGRFVTSIITWNGKEGNPLNECTLCRSG